MIITTNNVFTSMGSVALRVLANKYVVAAWLEESSGNFSIKKATSTDMGATWSIVEILDSIPFLLADSGSQHLVIDPAGDVYYATVVMVESEEGENTEIRYGKYSNDEWVWEELSDKFYFSIYFFFIDYNNTPIIVYVADTEDQLSYGSGIMQRKNDTWQDLGYQDTIWDYIGPDSVCAITKGLDGTIHVITRIPTGFLNGEYRPDDNDYYYKKLQNSIWSDPVFLFRATLSYAGELKVDNSNNLYFTYTTILEDGHDWTTIDWLTQIDANGNITTPEPLNILPHSGIVSIGTFYPSSKIYWFASIVNEALTEVSKIAVRIKNENGKWEQPVELHQEDGYSYSFLYPACSGSNFNGWCVLAMNTQIELQQPQLEFYMQEIESSSLMTPKQIYELEGLIVNMENGISEKNIDRMTAATYWRANGYPTIMTDDMLQVVILQNKETGNYISYDVNDFYVGSGNDSGYSPDDYDFIGLYWKNGLFNK
jgi:hypothetical protein